MDEERRLFYEFVGGLTDSELRAVEPLPYRRALSNVDGSSPTLDWISYASHHGSITIGGWLLDDIKHAQPGWNDFLWKPLEYMEQ